MPLTSSPSEVRIRATGEVVTEQAFRAMHPRTSFPRVLTTEIFSDFGADPVLESPAPAVTQYQSAMRAGVAQDALGNWVQAWTVRDWSAEEIQAAEQQKAASVQAEVVAKTQERLDAFAKSRNYDGILSACTYASSTVPKFQAEGQYCVNARDNTWSALYVILADVQAGARTMPRSYADIEPELPALVWPA